MDREAGGGGVGEDAEGFEGLVVYLVQGFRVLFSGVVVVVPYPTILTTFLW